MKHADCAEIGIVSHHSHLPVTATQADVAAVIDQMNADDNVHSILVQLPLPSGINEEEILLRVAPEKDVDGLHPTAPGYRLIAETMLTAWGWPPEVQA